MRLFLNAGFGDPLPASDLDLIRSLGYEGIRQNVPTVESAAWLVGNALDKGAAIFIIPVESADLCQDIAHAVAERIKVIGGDDRAVIEVGNEEDLRGKRWHDDPFGWSLLVTDVLNIAREHRFWGPVVSGGISSVSRSALDWLKRSRVHEREVCIGYHQYRSTSPQKALSGYSSRADEFKALKDIAGQDIWCTECGWSTAPRTKGWWIFKKTWSYSDAEVASFLRYEIDLQDSFNSKAFVTYQLNDGPNPMNDQDRFGVRRTDGSLKPQASVLLGESNDRG